MEKYLVSLSGGLDSTVLLADLLSRTKGVEIGCISFCYGSKHNYYENQAAQRIAAHYKLPWRLLDLTSIMEGFNSALLDKSTSVPEGHYEEESMRQTVVPGRNIIFISILSGLAWSLKASRVYLGIHSGDHFIYPDCRPNFFMVMRSAVESGTDGNVTLVAPFLNITKVDIVRIGIECRAPFELTRTCYKDQEVVCGRCGACQERLAAFAANKMTDPLPYESREILPKK